MLTSFYSTMAQVCFTLLGLWWIVVQFKYHDWMRNRRRRQMAYDTSLYFLLPGIMSLASLISTNGTVLWRITFTSAALLGAVESGFLLSHVRSAGTYSRLIRAAHWGAFGLYALVAFVALIPSTVHGVGISLTALQVEGVLLSLLVFLGVNTTWIQFAEIGDDTPRFTP